MQKCQLIKYAVASALSLVSVALHAEDPLADQICPKGYVHCAYVVTGSTVDSKNLNQGKYVKYSVFSSQEKQTAVLCMAPGGVISILPGTISSLGLQQGNATLTLLQCDDMLCQKPVPLSMDSFNLYKVGNTAYGASPATHAFTLKDNYGAACTTVGAPTSPATPPNAPPVMPATPPATAPQ